MKIDRRVQRTHQLLRDSLIELILKKGYDAVTVQDITDHANLGRATFYLHYRDKEELLITSLQETFDELVKIVSPITRESLESNTPPPVLIAFQHAEQNKDLYRVMLNGQGAMVITRRIQDYLVGVIRQRIEEVVQYLPPNTAPFPTDVLVQHMVGSLLALITWWLEEDTPYTAQQMAEMYHRLNSVQALMLRLSADLPKGEPS